ncbi:cupin domain-containing protein [Nocardia sp. NPDC004068]|uniref:cupin domain-containing protein n=1 Tax=Nocardia sp. NPDC004068 TaxID=3364303 RepID=UPI003690C1DD
MAITNRRIVTGLNSAGRSSVLSDDTIDKLPGGTSEHPLVWATPGFPANNEGSDDPMAKQAVGPEMFSDGSGFVFMSEMEPGYSGPFHATNTLDFVFVTHGRVRITLEDGDAIAGPGDIIVDRGVAHQWSVVGDEPVVLAAVVLPAIPLRDAVTKASF